MDAVGARRRRGGLVGVAVAATLAVGISSAVGATTVVVGTAVAPRVPATLQAGRLVQPLPIVSSCPTGGACLQSLISPGYPVMALTAGGPVQLQLGAAARSLSVELGGVTTPLGSGQSVTWRVPAQGGDAIVTAVYPQATITYLLRFAAQPASPAPPSPAVATPAGTLSPSAGSGGATPPVATVCAPGSVHLEAGRTVDAPALGAVCHAPGVGPARLAPADVATASALPRITMRPGGSLRLRFDSPPRGPVRVELRRGPSLKLVRFEQLSPVATTWRAGGGGSGVLVVVARFEAPVAGAPAALVEGRYAVRIIVR